MSVLLMADSDRVSGKNREKLSPATLWALIEIERQAVQSEDALGSIEVWFKFQINRILFSGRNPILFSKLSVVVVVVCLGQGVASRSGRRFDGSAGILVGLKSPVLTVGFRWL